MNARLARLALALYPLAYRRRYGEEMWALVEDAGASPRAVADLARGALSAHLRPEPSVSAEISRDDRVRLGVSAVLFCWVVFVLAGLAFYKTTEGGGFEGSAAQSLLGPLHLGIEILAAIGSLAVVIGAAPLVLAVLRQAGPRSDARHATLLAGACVLVFGAATAALDVGAGTGSHVSDGVAAVALAAWTLIALGCGLGCAIAARRGLFAVAVSPRALRHAASCAAILATAMAGIALLTLVYLVDLVASATDLASAPNGPLGTPNTRLSMLLQLLVMFAVAVPAFLAATRAWRGALPR